mgnify:CR=1 FL=1
MSAHAKLSPSSATRWLTCPGSVALIDDLDEQGLLADDESAFAAEGTAAHEFAAAVLEKHVEPALLVSTRDDWTADMVEHIETYADHVLNLVDSVDAELVIEARVEFDQWVPGGLGTTDAAVIDYDGRTVHVIDFKYGQGVRVSAHENAQLKLYAAGILQSYAWASDFDTFVLTIVQPRKDSISTFELTREELERWLSNVVTPAATLALSTDAPLVPSVDACRWCRARALCKARAEANLDAFRGALGVRADAMTPAALAEAIAQASDMQSWLKDIEAEGMRIARGGKLPGYKVVRARGRRRWVPGQEEMVAATLGEDAWKKTLVSLGEAEKRIGKDHSIFSTCVETPEGKEKLVPASDKRPAVVDASSVFSETTEGQ